MVSDTEQDILQSREALHSYILREEYRGYDPYDALNTRFSFIRDHKWPSVIAIQIMKRLPFNIRPLLGIAKGLNPKGLGLILHARSLDYMRTGDESILQELDTLYTLLMRLRTEGMDNLCWGYDFQWASPVKVLPAYSPTIVVSVFIAKGLRAYYEATGRPEVLEALKSIGRFAIDDLAHHRDEAGLCVSYSTVKKDICHNASLLAGELFATLYVHTGQESYRELAYEIARFSASAQLADGSWSYSRDMQTGEERMQIDFHQGYVTDSIRHISKDLGLSDFDEVVDRGYAYYRGQFDAEGRSYFRIPRQWPSDIHHQAQGVVSFSAVEPDLAARILRYTITHFQQRSGAFSYRQHKYFTDRTVYMRWGQAWMLLAMSTYLYARHTKVADELSADTLVR